LWACHWCSLAPPVHHLSCCTEPSGKFGYPFLLLYCHSFDYCLYSCPVNGLDIHPLESRFIWSVFQGTCPQVCLSSQCLTLVLTFLFSSHNSHGLPSRLCVVGSGLVCIGCQWFFAWSMALFHLALLQSARADWSWCPFMCLLTHFIFVFWIPAQIAWMISYCLSNGLLAHSFKLFVRVASLLHTRRIDPCVCW